MIVSDVITRVRSQFGDATGIQISDSDILNWINDGMRDVAYEANLNQTRAEADVIQGQSEYTLPSDYLTIFSVNYLGSTLLALSIQEKDNFIQNADSLVSQKQQGICTHYWIWAQTIYLFPTPQTSTLAGLVCYYTRTPSIVSQGSDTLDIPISYQNSLLDRVLQRAYEKDDDWQAAQIKESQYATNVARLAEDASYNEHEAYPSITVSPRDAGTLGGDGTSGSLYIGY